MKRKVIVVAAHPASDSLTAALAKELMEAVSDNGRTAKLIDLYKEGFDPLLTLEEGQRRFSFDPVVQTHQEQIRDSELVIWIHPDWWGGMPAILKGWLDRVLQSGFAFSFEEEPDGRFRRLPLLRGKKALAVITSDADAVEPVPAVDIWEKRVFPYCGFNPAEVLLLPETRDSDYLTRREFFKAGREAVSRLLTEEDGE